MTSSEHEHGHENGHENGHEHTHGHDDHVFDEDMWAEFAQSLEEEGEVLSVFALKAIDRVINIRAGQPADVRHIIDVGSGPGVGSTAWATAFPTAIVTAADSSPSMLARAVARAERHDLGSRVRAVAAEMPAGLAGMEPADIVWASMSLHHVGDEIAALQTMYNALVPGGLVVIAEFPPSEGLMSIASPSIDLEAPELWQRVSAASSDWFVRMRASLPDHKESRPLEEMIAEAGFELVWSGIERMHLDAPLSDRERRLAIKLAVGLARRQLATHLSASDLAYLDALADPDDPRCLLRRDDVSINTAQLIVIARRSATAERNLICELRPVDAGQ